jgi:hypothetical protein
MNLLKVLQIIAVIGTILTGLLSLLVPTKIEGFTGIKPVGGRGITEIRAVFGGLFIGLGIAAFLLDTTITFPMLGIMYLAIGTVRVLSMFLDRSIMRSNLISLLVEIIFGVLLVLK